MVDIGIEKAEMSLHRLAKKTKSKFFTRVSEVDTFRRKVSSFILAEFIEKHFKLGF